MAVATRLVISEPMELASVATAEASLLMDEAAAAPPVLTASAIEVASLLMDEMAAAPPVLAASAIEVAIETTSDPTDWPPSTTVETTPVTSETIEFTSTPSGEAMAAVARKRAEEIRVNFILEKEELIGRVLCDLGTGYLDCKLK